jgi:zinc transport system substrate-binding protein
MPRSHRSRQQRVEKGDRHVAAVQSSGRNPAVAPSQSPFSTGSCTPWLAIVAGTAVVGATLIGLSLGGCGGGDQSAGPQKPIIAVSIFPVASLVEQLTSPWADVVTLLPPGTSEHDAELHPDQLRELSRAEMLVTVGMGIDDWAEKAAASAAPQLKPLRFAELIGRKNSMAPKPEHDSAADDAQAPSGPNNHLWLDPVLAQQFVAALVEPLIQRFPARQSKIRAAAAKLTVDLQELDKEYRDRLAHVPTRELITFHNAFDLIAERYHLKIVARMTDIEVSPGGEVTPHNFVAAIDAIRKYHLAVIYGEPEFSADALAVIRRETGVEVLQLDPLGGPQQPGYKTYQAMMRSNLDVLVKGQSGSAGASPTRKSVLPLTSDGALSDRK